MSTRYLLHFVHEHITFRWTEFLAVTSKNNCNFKLISRTDHLKTRPFIIIELQDEDNQESNLINCAKGSYLLKDLYELWAHSSESLEDLANLVEKTSKQFLEKRYSQADQSFRVDVETFNSKIRQSEKIEWIKKMHFFDSFQCRPNLSSPKQKYAILEMNDRLNDDSFSPIVTKEYYFARHLAQGDRNSISSFSLKTRKFIANTSMDPTLSLITANAAKIKPNDIVYDPFVGSGSLLVAAAYLGAHVFGSDIDWLLLHGKSRPSRKGQAKRDLDENVESNLRQYNLEKKFLNVVVSDITRKSIREDFKFDAIIADPPYGVRECLERIGSKENRINCIDDKSDRGKHNHRFPKKINYQISDLLVDLYLLAAKHLVNGGRLVYYLPVIKSEHSFDQYIPEHCCLKLISYCEQSLTAKLSRLMVVVEKIKDPSEDDYRADKVIVPGLISDTSFRETYFTKNSEIK